MPMTGAEHQARYRAKKVQDDQERWRAKNAEHQARYRAKKAKAVAEHRAEVESLKAGIAERDKLIAELRKKLSWYDWPETRAYDR